jgi:hypothetical protein
MSLSLYADYTTDPIVCGNTEPRWREVGKGLKLAMLGYLVSTTGAVLTLFLASLALQEWAARQQTAGKAGPILFLLLLGVAALALVTVAGYALLLIGHWSCLVHAPAHPGARGMMLGCLTCFLIGLVMHMAAPFAGGAQFYEAWLERLGALKSSDLMQGSGLIHLVGCGLWLVSAVAFSQFLRGVTACFNDAGKSRNLDLYLVAVSLLLGASIGLPLCVPRLGAQVDLVFWLAGGWSLCYLWFLLLIARVRRCILNGLEGCGTTPVAAGWVAVVGQHAPHTLSGLHRLCQLKSR